LPPLFVLGNAPVSKIHLVTFCSLFLERCSMFKNESQDTPSLPPASSVLEDYDTVCSPVITFLPAALHSPNFDSAFLTPKASITSFVINNTYRMLTFAL
jgi:hypothetical protein